MKKSKDIKKNEKNNINNTLTNEETKDSIRKKKRGFTLIELLAVIIILGILMIIAIPSVTSYINESRKSAYINTAKQLISSARNFVNEGKVGLYDPNVTYYIPTSCLKVENGDEAESPYGKFVDAYVIVKFEGQGYKYYWRSIDDVGVGIKEITSYNDLDTDDISSDLNVNDFTFNDKIDGTDHVVLFDEATDCTSTKIILEEVVEEDGPTSSDHITWTYKDLSLAVDAHLSNCSIQGNYRMCYGATINIQSKEPDSVIRTFTATFDVPEGTELISGAYDTNKAIVELNGTKLTITGNPSGGAQNYITTSGIDTGFQIKIPKDVDMLLLTCQIDYNLVSSNTQEGSSSGGQGTLENMNGTTSNENLRVVLNRFNQYQSGGSNVTTMQYNVEVTNLTNQTMTNWSFTLEAPDSIQNIYTYSGLQASKIGNVYTFTPYSYSEYKTLTSGQTATFNNCLVIETTNSSETPTIK